MSSLPTRRLWTVARLWNSGCVRCVSTKTPLSTADAKPFKLGHGDGKAGTEGSSSGSSVARNFLRTKTHSNHERSDREYLEEQQFGPLGPNARSLLRSLETSEADPEAALQTSIAKGEATADIIKVCLQNAYYRATRTEKRRKWRIASMVLDYIWTDHLLWSKTVQTLSGHVYPLCYFAAKEGLQGIMMDWIRIPDRAFSVDSTCPDSRWRSNLLSCLIPAVIIHHGRIDAGLKCFFEVVDASNARIRDIGAGRISPDQDVRIPYTGACIQIISHMANPGRLVPSKDAQLFERFYKFRANFEKKAAANGKLLSHRFTMAELAMLHPTRPEYLPAMDFLREISAEEFKESRHRDKVWQEHVKRLTRQTYALAEKSGRKEDAIWVEEKYQALFRQGITSEERPTASTRPMST